jgi:hypothetical protein
MVWGNRSFFGCLESAMFKTIALLLFFPSALPNIAIWWMRGAQKHPTLAIDASAPGDRIEEGAILKNIVVSMQNALLADSIVKALRETGNFRPERILPDRIGGILPICSALNADVLVMEVGRQSNYSLSARLAIAQTLSRALPTCKTALICDENADPEIAAQVKKAKQDGRIDAFVYASVSASYLMAMLDAL